MSDDDRRRLDEFRGDVAHVSAHLGAISDVLEVSEESQGSAIALVLVVIETLRVRLEPIEVALGRMAAA